MNPIKKAIFPVAGLGTRFLPATKANPKEMLTVVDKPLIQYAAEEAVKAGITELIFVTSANKRAIEDHFDSNFELEHALASRGNLDRLEIVKNILPEGVSCAYVRQREALGLGHAVLCAQPLIGDEPFAVLLADDLIDNDIKTCLEQMVDLFKQAPNSMVAVQRIPKADSKRYGIIEVENEQSNRMRMKNIIEKPAPEDAPSNLAAVGRYILTPKIFEHLANTSKGAGGEIQLTDAIASLLSDEAIDAYEFEGTRYDCGSKLGYLQATISLGVKHPEEGEHFKQYLQSYLAG